MPEKWREELEEEVEEWLVCPECSSENTGFDWWYMDCEFTIKCGNCDAVVRG